MKTRFLISESIQALRSGLLRSLLTIVGIVVGIFSVTAMLALGEGLSGNILDRLSSFSSGDVSISGEITYVDYSWITEQPYVSESVASLSISNADVIVSGTDFSPTVQVVVGNFESLQSYDLLEGDVYDWLDPSFDEKVTVVTNTFADSVLEDTGQSAMGQKIIVGGNVYTVIGVIETSGISRGDGNIYVPYKGAIGTLTNTKNFSSVSVLLEDATYFEIAGQHMLEGLNASRQLALDSEDIFSVETSQSFIETAQETTAMLSLFLGVVGSIALFVGGIGTMNMMLTTVTERTKEIGLRKAVGARNRDIMLQILVESVVLTSLGGFIGILLSVGAGKIANQIFADSDIITVVVSSEVIIIAAIISVVIGVVFGLYPARNASRLQPVDALRSE